MPPDDTRQLLQRVLDQQNEALELGYKTQGDVIRLATIVQANEAACQARHSSTGAKLERITADVERDSGSAAKRLEELEDKRITEIERERDELKGSKTHWVRYVIMVLVGMFTGGVLLALGKLIK